MSNSILKTQNLSCGYGDTVIAENINLDLTSGEITSLIGPNGSGKTTILKTCGGFLKPIFGNVYLEGQDMMAISQSGKSKAMSVMMTERMATDMMTVRDMVAIGRFPYTDMLGRLADSDEKVISDALDKVGLRDISDKIYNDLSDGQKQRALLARAISQEPRVMLLDEPTSYLDIHHKLRFIDILKELARKEDIAILMSVHELEIAYEISDKVVCLGADGKVKSSGTPREVFSEDIISELYDLKPGRLSDMYGGFLDGIRGGA